jgi:acyl-CoA thioesterase FadM
VRRHEITYLAPASMGDRLELTTEVTEMRGARGVRETRMRILRAGCEPADAVAMRTEWVWLRLADMRPTRVPTEFVAAFEALS